MTELTKPPMLQNCQVPKVYFCITYFLDNSSIIDIGQNLSYKQISQLLNELTRTLEVIYNLLIFGLRTEFLRAEKLTSFLISAIVLDCCPWNSSSGFVFTLWPDKKMADDYQKFFEFLEENTIFHLVLSVVLFLAKKTEENWFHSISKWGSRA